MFTAQTGLNATRHQRLSSNASDVSAEADSRESHGRNKQRRVSSSLIAHSIETDPIREAIWATSRAGPLSANAHDRQTADRTEETMSINEVTAAEEDVDVSQCSRMRGAGC
jgi:hypothetical protein